MATTASDHNTAVVRTLVVASNALLNADRLRVRWAGASKTMTAELYGVSRATLYRLLRGLRRP